MRVQSQRPRRCGGQCELAGSSTYDLIALDAASGKELWKSYRWFSWIESPPVVRDGVLYTVAGLLRPRFEAAERRLGLGLHSHKSHYLDSCVIYMTHIRWKFVLAEIIVSVVAGVFGCFVLRPRIVRQERGRE
jgi:hypothetical protein